MPRRKGSHATGFIRPTYERPNQRFGYIPDLPDGRDLYYEPTPELLASLHDKRPNLRDQVSPVMYQGNLGSCVLHAGSTCLRHRIIETGHKDRPLSRLQAYYDIRAVIGTINSDSGGMIRDFVKCAARYGVAHEDIWPYDVSQFKRRPSNRVYQDALRFEAITYKRVRIGRGASGEPIGASHVKAALVEGFPVIIGLTLYQSFEDAIRNGVVPIPNVGRESVLGGHAMCAIGSDEPGRERTFSTRNSWGDAWGDHGDCYIPEEVVGSDDFGADYWIIPEVTVNTATDHETE